MLKTFALTFLTTLLPWAVAADLHYGLIGYWKMDGNLLDSSTNRNPASLVNGAPFRPGVQGMSLWCTHENGVQRYASLGHPPVIAALSNQFSVSCWVYYARTNGTSRSTLFARMSYTASVWMLDITETNPNQLRLTIYTNAGGMAATGSSPVSFPSNAWVHVACVWDGTTVVVYTNGATNFSVPCNRPMVSDALADLWVGSRNGVYLLNGGGLDEVALYNRPLTFPEVQALRTGLYVQVTNATNGTALFGHGAFSGMHQGSLAGGSLETRLYLSNARGVEIAAMPVTADNRGDWICDLPALSSAEDYTAVAVTSNSDGFMAATTPLRFTWYASSNVTLNIRSRNPAGVPFRGTKVFGPAASTPWDGLRTNDQDGSVIFRGLWSGKAISLRNFAPESWGQAAASTNISVPDKDSTLDWVLESPVPTPESIATPALERGVYHGASAGSFRWNVDAGRPAWCRVTVHAVPLAGGARVELFDQYLAVSGRAPVEISAQRMTANLKPGIWVLEAKFSEMGQDDLAARRQRSLLFFYR